MSPSTAARSARVETLRNVSVSFGGYKTRALLRQGKGPTLLCLHGFADSVEGFRPLFEALHDVPGRLVALDLPGFGEGPPLAPRPARMLPQMLAFALAAIEHYAENDDAPLLLIGHSLGGRTVLAAAAKSVHPVAGVIALAPAPLRLRRWLQLIAAEQRILPRVTRLLRHLPDGFMRTRYLEGYRRTFYAPDQVDPMIFERAMEGLDAARVASHAEGLHRIGGELNEVLDLSTVAMPVDLVWGSNDRLVPASAADAYRRQIEHARYHELPGCGHEIARERPEVLARLVARRVAALSITRKRRPGRRPGTIPR